MSLQHTSTGATTRRWPATVPGSGPGRGLVLAVTLLAGVFMVAAGAWALLAPGPFADATGFPRHTHFVHDAGAFQLGIGITLLLATAVAAVDGDRAVVRSFEKAWKTRRIRRDPAVEVAPSTARGRPTGPAIHAHARRLDGIEASHAARLLAAKHPLLHGLLVPLSHRLGRAKTGRTVHFELTPLDGDPMAPPRHRPERRQEEQEARP
jgi:PPOX class probable F420-dependent enzyme